MYRKLPMPQPDGVVYENEMLSRLEAVLPNGGLATSHAPALLSLADGTLLCAWFAGSFEGGEDISIVLSRLNPGAQRWTEPILLSGDPTRSEQNPSLFQAGEGEIWAVYTAQLGRQPGKDNMQYTSVIRRQKSFDGGLTWTEADVLFPEEGSFCRQPIQVLQSGRWIVGNWLCTDSAVGLLNDRTVLRISDDQGQTWRTVDMPHSEGRVHANVVELQPGELAAFMRSRDADWIYRSVSHDNGDTWSEPVATVLPNNNSSISALKLQSGRLAIAYNPTQVTHRAEGQAAWPGLRCPVAVALSEDGGLTFPLIRHIELGEGFVGEDNRANNRQYEYPYLLQAADGRLHLAYAYLNRLSVKWTCFTEEAILGEKRGDAVYNPTSGQR